MVDKKFKIIILDDDNTFATGLAEAFRKLGHDTIVAPRPVDAETAIEQGGVDYVFVDCLLPQLSGLDFVTKIRQDVAGQKLKFVIMSGIYTDKSYVQEATKQTHAVGFLKKPFDLEDAIKLLRPTESIKKAAESSRRLIYQIFMRQNVASRDKRRIIDSMDELNGFDLPFLYSLLTDTKSSGYLNLYWENKTISGISFSNGCVVNVDVEDKQTRLGTMLIQGGFCMLEDVEETLKSPDGRKRLGYRLIHGNRLSPHGFDEMLQEQMNIRLAHTIVNTRLRVNFATSEVELTSPHVDQESMTEFLHDWVASKITLLWLKQQHILYLNNRLLKSQSFSERNPVASMQLVNSLEGFWSYLDKGTSINQLLGVSGYDPSTVYKAVHFLLLKGLVTFSSEVIAEGPSTQFMALKRIASELQGKAKQEIVDYLCFGSLNEKHEETFQQFLNVLGAEPHMGNFKDANKLWHELKSLGEQALLDAGTATIPSRDINKDRVGAEMTFQAQKMLEQVRAQLQLNQFVQAKRMLNEVERISTDVHNFHVLSAWAKLGLMSNRGSKYTLHDVNVNIMQIPPDEKYEAVFPFVEGLYKKASGDSLAARKSFERALALDSGFIPARRELSLISQNARKKQDVFNMDLKDVVTGLFNRKK